MKLSGEYFDNVDEFCILFSSGLVACRTPTMLGLVILRLLAILLATLGGGAMRWVGLILVQI